ncbi:unnamed protein product [Orchesella dallaii]|uniref:Uncharacterized protein n=1 Tax=Orchesella dallaii TaxID=48710 RepID=A0ABP1Q8M6_9HEXA
MDYRINSWLHSTLGSVLPDDDDDAIIVGVETIKQRARDEESGEQTNKVRCTEHLKSSVLVIRGHINAASMVGLVSEVTHHQEQQQHLILIRLKLFHKVTKTLRKLSESAARRVRRKRGRREVKIRVETGDSMLCCGRRKTYPWNIHVGLSSKTCVRKENVSLNSYEVVTANDEAIKPRGYLLSPKVREHLLLEDVGSNGINSTA